MAIKHYTIYTCDICGQEVDKCRSGTIEEYIPVRDTGRFIPTEKDFDICDNCYEKIEAFVSVLKAEANHD